MRRVGVLAEGLALHHMLRMAACLAGSYRWFACFQ